MELQRASTAVVRLQPFSLSICLSLSNIILQRNGLDIRPSRRCTRTTGFHTSARRPWQSSRVRTAASTSTPSERSSQSYDAERKRASEQLGWADPRSSPRVRSPLTRPRNSDVESISAFPDPDADIEAAKAKSISPMNERERFERILNRGSTAKEIMDSLRKTRRDVSSPFRDPRRDWSVLMENPKFVKPDPAAANPATPSASGLRETLVGLQVAEDIAQMHIPRKERPKLEPKLGRTVDVTNGVDLTKALRSLDITCAKNRVKRDATVQERFERAGQRKKRLYRERWRRCFKQGFQHICVRARQIAKQGW